MKPIIEVRNLSKKYKIGERQRYLSLRDSVSNLFSKKNTPDGSGQVKGSEFWALDDVNFDIQAGESIGIIGRNGAGKSTLLKILSRITPPTKGSVILRGRMASLLEVGTGFHSELTGRENVFMNGSILGLKKREIEAKFDEIVDFSGVEQFIDTPLKHYSSGMQLRLAFAVAAHLEPEILVIDEVLAVGDSIFQQKCMDKMTQLSQTENRTILFVSHNLFAVKQLCKKVILIDKGSLIKNGESQDVIDFYNQRSAIKGKEIDLKSINRNDKNAHRIIFDKIVFEKLNFQFGDNISFLLSIEKRVDILDDCDLEFGIAIYNQDGQCIVHASNIFKNQKITLSKILSKATYLFDIESNGLRTGKYTVTLFLRANGIIEDWLSQVVEFEINEGNPYNFNNTKMITGIIMPNFKLKYVEN
jgi:lipopolysaccharide transport system ATP-binding protein